MRTKESRMIPSKNLSWWSTTHSFTVLSMFSYTVRLCCSLNHSNRSPFTGTSGQLFRNDQMRQHMHSSVVKKTYEIIHFTLICWKMVSINGFSREYVAELSLSLNYKKSLYTSSLLRNVCDEERQQSVLSKNLLSFWEIRLNWYLSKNRSNAWKQMIWNVPGT